MRKGGDGWEIEEDEDENGGRGGGDLFVDFDFVRGANASPGISAALPRRLVSRGPSPIAIGIPSGERRRRAYRAPSSVESQWQIQLPFWTTERFSQREA